MSAPPVDTTTTATAAGSPRRFTTTINHQPRVEPTANTSSPGVHRRPMTNAQQPQQQQHSSGGGGTVRHIPIMVEGRDEPVLSSVVEEDQQTSAERRSKTAIPMPFYPSSNNKPTSSSSAAAVKKETKPTPTHDGSIPIALPYDRLSDDSAGRSVGSTSSDGPSVADLDQIGRIQRETEALLPRIEEFRGDRHDRDFLFLDEMYVNFIFFFCFSTRLKNVFK